MYRFDAAKADDHTDILRMFTENFLPYLSESCEVNFGRNWGDLGGNIISISAQDFRVVNIRKV